jgi:hypothetical protein
MIEFPIAGLAAIIGGGVIFLGLTITFISLYCAERNKAQKVDTTHTYCIRDWEEKVRSSDRGAQKLRDENLKLTRYLSDYRGRYEALKRLYNLTEIEEG